jgi:hypothetical protein
MHRVARRQTNKFNRKLEGEPSVHGTRHTPHRMLSTFLCAKQSDSNEEKQGVQLTSSRHVAEVSCSTEI